MEKGKREKGWKRGSNSTASVVAANVSEQWEKSFLSVIFSFQL